MSALLAERWAGETVVAHGVIHRPDRLPAIVAEDERGGRVGLATYTIDSGACEIVTIDALVPGTGYGRAMVDAVTTIAREAGCSRLRLITTNDNVGALAFYRTLGFEVVAVREGAIDEARKLKPSIPWVSEDGVPITDEIELERRL